MASDAAERLATAVREWSDARTSKVIPGQSWSMWATRLEDKACAVESALAAYDAERELREKKRDALKALEEWRGVTTPENAAWLSAEDATLLECAERLHSLLAARQAAGGAPGA